MTIWQDGARLSWPYNFRKRSRNRSIEDFQPDLLAETKNVESLARYYRRFVQRYDKISAPLFTMLYVWASDTEAAFDNLKVSMTTTTVIALPDFTKNFVVECVASGNGIGVC